MPYKGCNTFSSYISPSRELGMNKQTETKTICVKLDTYNRLTAICRKDQSYDDAVSALLTARKAP